MKILQLLFALALVVVLSGCEAGPKSARGFTLPEGDPEKGKAVFTQLHCHGCHSVEGVELPEAEDPEQTIVRLGGQVPRIKTYGELVTGIINPSHRLARGYSAESISSEEGESKMRNYNDVMSVGQLIDLVAFLQSHYELKRYEPTTYPPYF